MKLVMVHGIAQEDRDRESLTAEWTAGLSSAMPDPRVLDSASIVLPFYGKALDELTRGTGIGEVIEQGPGEADDAELAFVSAAMEDVARAEHLSARDIALEQRTDSTAPSEAIEQSWLMNRKINAIARLLEKVSPAHGRWVLPLVRQAYAYLRKPGVAPAVDAIVSPELQSGPMVVVAHSLGTVVCFKLLRAMAQAGRPADCQLFVTLGSPLALSSVTAALGAPLQVPPGVARWVNAVDEDDSVTLGKPLDASTFCAGIENIMDIENPSDDSPHDALGYLNQRRIAAPVEMALRGTT
jgi:hypothetical protein